MYDAFRQTCERILRLPHDPQPPPGDEASTRLFRAAPNYYKYLLFMWGLRTSLMLLVVAIISIGPVLGAITLTSKHHKWGLLLLLIPALVIVLIAAISLFSLAILRLTYEKRWYAVTNRSLRIREGVVAVREMTVNFANIQNISVSQGPIQRVLRIADLRVDTAGGGGAHDHYAHENLHTAWFHGIDNANEVRELIQQRLRLLKDSGLGDHEEMARRSFAGSSPNLLTALRQVHSEAQALRETLFKTAT
jgi:membrane protein YdbS with pleckstrin-like domain